MIEYDRERIAGLDEAEALALWEHARLLTKEADELRRAAWARVQEIRHAKHTDEERGRARAGRLKAEYREHVREMSDERQPAGIRRLAAVAAEIELARLKGLGVDVSLLREGGGR